MTKVFSKITTKVKKKEEEEQNSSSANFFKRGSSAKSVHFIFLLLTAHCRIICVAKTLGTYYFPSKHPKNIKAEKKIKERKASGQKGTRKSLSLNCETIERYKAHPIIIALATSVNQRFSFPTVNEKNGTESSSTNRLLKCFYFTDFMLSIVVTSSW